MRGARTAAAAGMLAATAGLAVLGVLFHYGLTAEYGDVTDLAVDDWRSRFSSDIGGLALLLVLLAALVTVAVTVQPWVRLAALTVPVLTLGAMVAVTPVALRDKLEDQFDETPQCTSASMGRGPGADAARESQQALETVDHVGHFSGGGGSGVGGCDRSLVLIQEVDLLQHYRDALPQAGWRLTETGSRHLRAEREGMAFEVVVCGPGSGVVWAGRPGAPGGARCTPVH